MLCCKARGVQRQGGYEVEDTNHYFFNFFVQVLNGGDKSKIQRFVIYARYIWLARNNMLWNNKRTTCYITYLEALQFWGLWNHTRNLKTTSLSSSTSTRQQNSLYSSTGSSNNEWQTFIDSVSFVKKGMLGFGAIMENT